MRTKTAFLICMLISLYSYAQTYSGQIFTEDGNVISNVHIYNVNFKNQTISDENGRFTLKANAGDSVVFSILGYERYVKRVSGSYETINLVFRPYLLDEVKISGDRPSVFLKGINGKERTKKEIKPMSVTAGASDNESINQDFMIPMSTTVTVHGPFSYFLKEEKEKRKMVKHRKISKKIIAFNEVVTDGNVKNELCEVAQVENQDYDSLVNEFYREYYDLIMKSSEDEIQSALLVFLLEEQ